MSASHMTLMSSREFRNSARGRVRTMGMFAGRTMRRCCESGPSRSSISTIAVVRIRVSSGLG